MLGLGSFDWLVAVCSRNCPHIWPFTFGRCFAVVDVFL
jgi:hypothetical protein